MTYDKKELKKKIESARNSFLADIREADPEDLKSLKAIRHKYLAKKGIVPFLYKNLVSIPLEDRSEIGSSINDVKSHMENLLKHFDSMGVKEDEAIYPDVTLPHEGFDSGSLHPITLTVNEVMSFFKSKGFEVMENTMELSSVFSNFDSLNVPTDHPARSRKDTFYIGKKHVLRTQTSAVQKEIMSSYKPPFKFIVPGSVYRRDSDSTHTPMFTQVEGISVGYDLTYLQLLEMLQEFAKYFFGEGVEMRIRPSYFPFTSPSAEVDVMLNGKLIEVLGCGMIHPTVMSHLGDNSDKLTGFAFGMGVERLAMLKYGLSNLRCLYLNDIRFLRQFNSLLRYEI